MQRAQAAGSEWASYAAVRSVVLVVVVIPASRGDSSPLGAFRIRWASPDEGGSAFGRRRHDLPARMNRSAMIPTEEVPTWPRRMKSEKRPTGSTQRS